MKLKINDTNRLLPIRRAVFPRKKSWPLIIALAFLLIAACDKDDGTDSTARQKKVYKDSLDHFFSQSEGVATVFTNVDLISMNSASILRGQDVFVKDGTIVSIASTGTQLTDGYQVVDGTQKYLMPGLADMHIHPIVSDHLIYDYFLFLAKGITTVRVMWGFDGHVELRDKINTGQIFGPTVYVASAGFDGSNKSWPGAINTYSISDVKSQIDEFSSKGYDFIKIYSGINTTQYNELIDYAWEKGIPPIGHVPNSVDAADALSRQHSISHLGKFLSSNLNETELYNQLASSSTAVCPTLTVLNRIRGREASYTGEWYDLISPDAREFYDETAHTLMSSESYAKTVSRVLKKIDDADGLIIAGSDMGIRFVLPGIALHEELEHYANAGLTPFRTLKTATINPAKFMSDDLSGRIESGYKADLVLLNSNPLDNVSNTEDIAGVMKDGRWLSYDNIEEVLSWIRSYYK